MNEREPIKYTGEFPPSPKECPLDVGCKWTKTIFGDWVQIEINTPFCCDPSTETFWSM